MDRHVSEQPGGSEVNPHPAIFEYWGDALPRIVFAPERSAVCETILGETSGWEGRYRITYVLLQSGPPPFEAGRYDYHGTLDRPAVERFIGSHGAFIAADGRHALWISSSDGQSLLAYDRYGLLTVFGNVASLRQRLAGQGLTQGFLHLDPRHRRPVDAAHDDSLAALMTGWKWLPRPLNTHDLA